VQARAWDWSIRTEQQYNRSLQRLRRQIITYIGNAASTDEIRRRLRVIQNTPEFNTFAESIAANMAGQVNRASVRQWRQMAQGARRQRGDRIFTALQRELRDTPIGGRVQDIIIGNADLIKTLPNRLDAEMSSFLAKINAQGGMRPEQVMRQLMGEFDNLLEYQARRIARTETAKAQSALTQARSENLGIDWYVWRTAQDGMRVRESHRHMEGVLVGWSNPPNPESLAGKDNSHGPYHAGNFPNCRCYSEPLISIDWVSWPHRVYIGGAIVTMSRKEFEPLIALAA